MPIYEAYCRGCDIEKDYHRSVAEYLDTPFCPSCGQKMSKVVHTAPKGFVKGKFEPFKSMIDGSVITSERDLREHNLRNNVVHVSEGYSEDKLLSESFTPAPPAELDKKELAEDVREAITMVNQGYKPEVHDAA